MTQGYIIQFYHPIEADLPEDIRERLDAMAS